MIRPLWKSALLWCAVMAPIASGQNPAPTPRQVLAGVLASLNSANLQDATLTGSSEFIAGKTDESGTFTAQTAVNGFHRLQLDLPTASRVETRTVQNGTIQGFWQGSQGVQHSSAQHNLLVGHSWFFPSIALSRLLQLPSSVFTFAGAETKDGTSVEHYSVTGSSQMAGNINPKLAHLTKIDLYLDSETLRPVILDFNIHPDNNALLDIQVEIRYSEYTEMDGAWIPAHVQRYVNSALNLDLTIQSAQFNTGFPESLAK